VEVASRVGVRVGYLVGAATGLGAGASLVWILTRKVRGPSTGSGRRGQ
jgi:hypothetical protein